MNERELWDRIRGLERRLGDMERREQVYVSDWTNYSATSTVTGWSSTTAKLIYYRTVGKIVFVWFRIEGTSNSTTTSFTLPYANQSALALNDLCRVYSGGTYAVGLTALAASSSTLTISVDVADNPFPNSGGKYVRGLFTYPRA